MPRTYRMMRINAAALLLAVFDDPFFEAATALLPATMNGQPVEAATRAEPATMGVKPPAAAAPAESPILLDAQSSEFDYRNNNLVFHKVRIAQGGMSVAADQAQATGLDFENSHWVFRGNVRITLTQGELTSDEADITFAKKSLAKALISGNPAEFEQRNAKSGRPVQGRAQTMEYDVGRATVRLSKEAWLSDGQNEIRGESLKYNILEQRVVADAAEQNAQRVHITIAPPAIPKP